MTISETTKRVVLQQRRALQSRFDKNLKDIEGLEAQIAALQTANTNLKKEIDALKKDVAEPSAK